MSVRFYTIIGLIFFNSFILSAQSNNDSIRMSLADMHTTLTKTFESLVKDSVNIVEQTALAELNISEGRITDCRFWSINGKGYSALLDSIFQPLINKYYKSLENANLIKLIIPVKVQDLRDETLDKGPLEGADFLSYFTYAYKMKSGASIYTSWMLSLIAEKGPNREKKKTWK